MLKVKIHKVKNCFGFKGDSIVGQFKNFPNIGEKVFLVCPLENEECDYQVVQTSEIINFEDTTKGRQITTRRGSVFFIELLGVYEE